MQSDFKLQIILEILAVFKRNKIYLAAPLMQKGMLHAYNFFKCMEKFLQQKNETFSFFKSVPNWKGVFSSKARFIELLSRILNNG